MVNHLRSRWLKRDHRFVLALADTHVLHACGLAPRGWTTSTGNKIELNKAQSYLADCYEHLLDKLPRFIDTLLLVGDICEGQNIFDFGVELTEVDRDWQVAGAVELLQPIVDKVGHTESGCKSIFMIKGSKYHGRYEAALGRIFNAKPFGGHYAPYWREIMANKNVLFDVGHTQSYMMRYKSTPLAREIGFKYERAGKMRKVLPEDIVIVRAHTHQYGTWMETGATCVALPSMKVQDDYAKGGKTPNRTLPDSLGAIGFRVYEEPKEGKRVHIIPYLYDHPDDEPEVM